MSALLDEEGYRGMRTGEGNSLLPSPSVLESSKSVSDWFVLNFPILKNWAESHCLLPSNSAFFGTSLI